MCAWMLARTFCPGARALCFMILSRFSVAFLPNFNISSMYLLYSRMTWSFSFITWSIRHSVPASVRLTGLERFPLALVRLALALDSLACLCGLCVLAWFVCACVRVFPSPCTSLAPCTANTGQALLPLLVGHPRAAVHSCFLWDRWPTGKPCIARFYGGCALARDLRVCGHVALAQSTVPSWHCFPACSNAF